MDIDYVTALMVKAFLYTNRHDIEDMHLISVSYEGPADSPNTLVLKVRNKSSESTGCWAPLSVISFAILGSNPKTVFPASLEKIKVECYSTGVKLIVSYQVFFDDAVSFGKANKVDPSKLNIIENNLTNFDLEVSKTPIATYSLEQTYTSTPRPTYTPNSFIPTGDPMANVTAICGDGTYSYSKTRQGTCSGHKGVKEWIHSPSN